MRFFTSALAVILVIVAHVFLLSVGSPPTVALRFAYGASGVFSAAAAWMLWRRTID